MKLTKIIGAGILVLSLAGCPVSEKDYSHHSRYNYQRSYNHDNKDDNGILDPSNPLNGKVNPSSPWNSNNPSSPFHGYMPETGAPFSFP